MIPLLPIILAATAVIFFSSEEKIRGVNFLQSRSVPMQSDLTDQSLQNLRKIGANTVAIIPFLEQPGFNSTNLSVSNVFSQEQLLASIRKAKQHRYKVVLKPQILVKDSWAGEISFSQEKDWRIWFANYQAELVNLALLAETEGVDILVIGTELRKTGQRKEWLTIINKIREHYSGELSYAAHNVSGVRAFNFWDALDSAAVTLYPSLGTTGDRTEMTEIITQTSNALEIEASKLNIPLWIAEIGISSRIGAHYDPWEWRNIPDSDKKPDEALQSLVIELWIDALDDDWNKGLLLWCWFNDPESGGSLDTGFTFQNKKAEKSVACRWNDRCEI